jgi:ABC-type polysaccharide/polyol phosphate export permease
MQPTLASDFRDMIREQYTYRELLYQMTRRDLLLRYKQTVMGFGWAIFMPLVNTAVFSVIFTRVAPIDTGVPYPAFAYCGLFTWNFFASSLRFAVNSLTTNTNLVSKVFFPREIFPYSSTMVSLVDLAVSSVVMALLMLYYRIPPTGMIVFLPVVLFVQLLFTLGMSLLLAMSNLFYRDVKYLFEIVLTVWMFMTSVLYPVSLVGGKTAVIMQLNPLTPIIDGYRAVLLYGQSPFTPAFLLAAAVSVVLFFGAWLVFHRAEFEFAENV